MLRYCVQFVLLLVFYHLCTRIGLSLKVLYGDVSPLWPPAGLALAMVWYSGWRWLPVVLAGEILAAAVLRQPLWTGLTGGIGIMAEVIVAMTLIYATGIQRDLATMGQVLRFFGIVCLVSPLAAAAVGLAGLMLTGLVPIEASGPVWITWWLGDALGIMLLTPFIWFWFFRRPASIDALMSWVSVSCLVVAFFLLAYLWYPSYGWTFFFLLLPYVIYSAVKLQMHGASMSLMLMAALVLGEGWRGETSDFLLNLKMAFIGTCCLTGYLLAVMVQTNRRSQELLESERSDVASILHSVSDGIIKADRNNQIRFINPMATKVLGISGGESPDGDFDRQFRFMSLDSEGRRIYPLERYRLLQPEELLVICGLRLRRSADAQNAPIKDHVVELRICPSRLEGSLPDSYSGDVVIVLRDITADMEVRRLLEFQTRHDHLTGLPNRRGLDEELKEQIRLFDNRTRGALLYVDLDQFKLVNDTCGHEVGDLMLKSLSTLLRKTIGDRAFLARIGGDEFAVLMADCGEQQAMVMARELHRVITEFHFEYEDLSFSLGASIGLTTFSGNDRSAQALLSRADIACYKAKEKGRNRISLFHAEDSEMLRYKGELEWVSQLRRAIDGGDFKLFQQGIHDLDEQGSPSLAGREILIRLEQNGKFISPGSFIPIAERFGFMPVIDRWVTETLFQQLSSGQAEKLLYNINLSAATFNDESFFSELESWAEQYGIDRSLICFEVTESVALQDIRQTRNIIHHFSSLGYQFALDDFGSGAASYAYLSQLPVNFVKLDGSFVRSINNDPIARVVIDSLVKIAGIKGITCIAECVETAEEAALLQELGIRRLQGYLYSRPVPLREESQPEPHDQGPG